MEKKTPYELTYEQNKGWVLLRRGLPEQRFFALNDAKREKMRLEKKFGYRKRFISNKGL